MSFEAILTIGVGVIAAIAGYLGVEIRGVKANANYCAQRADDRFREIYGRVSAAEANIHNHSQQSDRLFDGLSDRLDSIDKKLTMLTEKFLATK